MSEGPRELYLKQTLQEIINEHCFENQCFVKVLL